MPFGKAIPITILPPLPQPPPLRGPTDSPVKNWTVGTLAAVGSNLVSSGELPTLLGITDTQLGGDISSAAVGANIIVQIVKQWEFFDQHRWGMALVLVVSIAILIFFADGDIRLAVQKGFMAAWQALMNYHSGKLAGLNILPSAADPKPISALTWAEQRLA